MILRRLSPRFGSVRHALAASVFAFLLFGSTPSRGGLPEANLSLTKTDSVTSSTPGGLAIYTITATNAGPSNAPGSQVIDNLPAACIEVDWTCVGSAGGSCTAGPIAGNINDTVNLPVGGTVTYTVICHISPIASGTLENTASVATAGGVVDPTPANNSASDTNTLAPPNVNLTVTKTDGLTQAAPGQAITYTINIANSGPSAAVDATVIDTLPPYLVGVTWTCVAGFSSSCTAAGSGNISDTATIWPTSAITYTVQATIPSNFLGGTIVNTASSTRGSGLPGALEGSDSTFVPFQSLPPREIPTLSPFGTSIVALLLAAAAFVALRRRSAIE